MPVVDMEKLVSLARRRGFIFQSSEIYGGINGFWDYGPLGVELKKNIKDAWWHDMVRNPPLGPDGHEISMVGVDCAIIMNPKVWEASGHVGGFADLKVDCLKCNSRLRADKVFWLNLTHGFKLYPNIGSIEADSRADADEYFAKNLVKLAKKFNWGKDAVEAYNNGTYRVINAVELYQEELASISENVETHVTGVATFSSGEKGCSVPGCGGDLTPPRAFNLMFGSHAGPIASDENKVYLRPETAQGIFVNFKNVLDSTRLKLPFGVAQIGKSFRNEVNPRNYIFRSREFEQMEIEFFCRPDESPKWYKYWREVRKNWYTNLGIKSEQLRPREQTVDERAFYSVGTTDIEYLFPFSNEPQELEGVAHRADYDLKQHMDKSGKDLRYFDEEGWNALLTERLKPFEADKAKREEEKKKLEKSDRPKFNFLPHVIEPSAGADRFTLAVLCEAYTEDKLPNDKGQLEERLVMKFHPRLAPIKAAIFPLVKKDGMPELAEKLYHELKQDYNVVYDDGGAIGRRYRRQDEVGTPFCITIDGETLQNQTVTIRDRDSAQQRRVPIGHVRDEIRAALRS